ncbi:hypothetical protein [Desulfobacula sp.]|uniref:hypothetical protein n=1 Tax=Desulfobacula sp. TaxID=2593537 RepID=UPI002631A93A|nr:hypothetical protein [Desulfobacula sp.]
MLVGLQPDGKIKIFERLKDLPSTEQIDSRERITFYWNRETKNRTAPFYPSENMDEDMSAVSVTLRIGLQVFIGT